MMATLDDLVYRGEPSELTNLPQIGPPPAPTPLGDPSRLARLLGNLPLAREILSEPGSGSPVAGWIAQIATAPPPPAPPAVSEGTSALGAGNPEASSEGLPAPGTGVLDRLRTNLQDRLGSLVASPSTTIPNTPGATFQPPTSLPAADALADQQAQAVLSGSPSPIAPSTGPPPEPIKGQGKIVQLASTQVGAPYVWARIDPVGGGTSGFDCSGLTRWVYSKFGVELPHLSSAQQEMTTPVSREDLRPGDLVFFHYTDRNGPSAADHVGIYAGGNTMIDAGSGGVERSPIDWSNFIGGGRVEGATVPQPQQQQRPQQQERSRRPRATRPTPPAQRALV
jgi:cell wall-associated NlpC family hydrolase